jgi:Lon protease-like protein
MDARIDTSALDALPIFPLPDVVLFPGALLPLHVFEPRYREMTADVLAGKRLMAIVRLRPGYEADYEGAPAVFATAGIGYVVTHEPLPDGRSNILLRGVGRMSIEREHPTERKYRTVRARVLTDSRSERPEDAVASHRQLVAVCDHLAAAMPQGGDVLRALVRSAPSPGTCADVIAAALVRDADERQRLLETLDPADRLDRLVDHASHLLLRFRSGSEPLN